MDIKDPTRPDVRTLVDSTQDGAIRHIRLAIPPTRPSLAESTRVIKGLKNPASAKFDGWQAHRRALTPAKEHGLVSTMGPNGLFYASAVGAFGAVHDGGKLGPTSERCP